MILERPKPHDWGDEICSLDAEYEVTTHTNGRQKTCRLHGNYLYDA